MQNEGDPSLNVSLTDFFFQNSHIYVVVIVLVYGIT